MKYRLIHLLLTNEKILCFFYEAICHQSVLNYTMSLRNMYPILILTLLLGELFIIMKVAITIKLLIKLINN